MSIFKEPIKNEIKGQITIRQNTMAASTRTPQQLTWLNSRNSWIRMSSAVEVNGDNGALAQQYVLQGGTLNLTTNGNTAVSSSLKTGVGDTFKNAYSTQNAGGTDYRSGIRPMPGITSVEVKSRGAYGSLREATVNFQCWDIKQLEELELLYMRPGYSVLVEWGWSPYLNNSGVLVSSVKPIDNVILGSGSKEQIWREIFTKNKNTNGNYDAIYGIIKNYSWKARSDGGYDCTTVLITMGEVLESLKINYAATDTLVPQVGLFTADLQAAGAIIPFPVGSLFSKAHQSNIIAGMVTELWLIGRQALNNQTSFIVRTNGGSSAGGFDLKMARFDVTTTGRAQNLKKTIFDNDSNIYIQLDSFIELLNKYVLVEDSKNNQPYAAVSVREGEFMEHPGRPLLCLGNRYQISTNPLVCLIDNNNYIDPTVLGYSGFCTTIPQLMTGLDDGMYDRSAFRFIESYFYDGAGRNSDEYGVIGNIYVNLAYIYSLVVDEELENTDKKEKKDINLFDFLKSLMKGINAVIGNVANFELYVDPQDSVIRIIDVNYVNPESSTNVKNNAPTIQLQNTKSIVRNYSFESQIFPEQSTIVAIGAQAEGGALGENVKTLIDFNHKLIDRIIPRKEAPTSKGSTSTTKKDNISKNFKILSEYFCNLDPSWWEFVGDFDADEASSYENALKDVIKYVLENPNLGGLNNKAIIPTKLSIEMDGLGGFIIGNIFKINDDVIPRGYKGTSVGTDIGYVITGLNHSIKDGDWTTKIESQFIILEDPKTTANLTAATSPLIPNPNSALLAAATNIGINGTVFLGSVKADYLISIDQAKQEDVKVNFTHNLTLKDGRKLSQEVTGIIPAGNTSAVVSVEFSETIEDLLTDENAASFTNIATTINNSGVTSNTNYSFAGGANEVDSPIPLEERPEQKDCPEFPSSEKDVVDLVIQALDRLGYSYFTKPWHLNVVGIRNIDKDFGLFSKNTDIDPKAATPSITDPALLLGGTPSPTQQQPSNNQRLSVDEVKAIAGRIKTASASPLGTDEVSLTNAILRTKNIEQFWQVNSWLKTISGLDIVQTINAEFDRGDEFYVSKISNHLKSIGLNNDPGIALRALGRGDDLVEIFENNFTLLSGPPQIVNRTPTMAQKSDTSTPRHEGSAIIQKGYVGLREKDPKKIIGKPVINAFTDWLVAWYYDDKGNREVKVGRSTTVPGYFYQKIEFFKIGPRSLGRNITLLEGHYKNYYVKGHHGKKINNTLRTNENYTSMRPIYRIDKSLDAVYTFDGFWEGEKLEGGRLVSAKKNNPYITKMIPGETITGPDTNVHPSGTKSGDAKEVNDWSAGCQVWREFDEWEWMSKAALKQIDKTKTKDKPTGKTTFDYSLLNLRDLPGYENC